MVSEPEVEVDSKKVEQMKRVISPYDLNSNDNPGNIITQVRLRGDENYDEWACAVRTSLRARRKCDFVEGTIPEPDKELSVYDDWWTVQSMLVSRIRNTIDSDLRTTILHMENAKDLWDDIKKRFSVANGPRIQQIKTELSECKQRGMSIVAYYGKSKALWDDLANYDQIPTCLCAGCKCDISTKLERRREEEKVHQFLMGLDEASYGTVRTNMLATEPLPSLNKVYATLIREERVKNATQDRTSRMPIGAGEQRDGLYYFRKVSRAKTFKTEVVDSLDLLHKRLGHPSIRSTKLIPMVSSSEDTKVSFVSRDVDFFENEFPFNQGDTTFRIEHDEIGLGDGIKYSNEWEQGDEEGNEEQSQLGRGHRVKQPSVRLRDFVTNTICKLSPSTPLPTPSHASVDNTQQSDRNQKDDPFINCKDKCIYEALKEASVSLPSQTPILNLHVGDQKRHRSEELNVGPEKEPMAVDPNLLN
nr:retrovirus-related Pol polyprotein from transposon TNT 1-94 [Ipomoea batatas]